MAERQRRGKRPVTTTRNEDPTLDPEEERVVRMRHGYRRPDDAPLPQKAEGDPELQAKLREIERQAFEASGRAEKMKEEAEAEAKADAKKQKIVDRLKKKND